MPVTHFGWDTETDLNAELQLSKGRYKLLRQRLYAEQNSTIGDTLSLLDILIHDKCTTVYDVIRFHMTLGVYGYLKNGEFCRRRKLFPKHQRRMQLFLPSRLLEFVAIAILGFLTKASQRNRREVVMRHWNSKPKKAASRIKITSSVLETTFYKH